MTPERRRDFETEWPDLAARLHRMLARRGMPATLRDDVVQETAARLYGTWEDVDRSRPAWPLTRAIALNHLRDQGRRKIQEIASEIPEVAHHYNVEAAGLARVELGRVRDALDNFTPQARQALLVEVGAADRELLTPAAQKMQRMRARRKLKVILERTPAAIALRFARLADFGEWLLGGRAMFNGGLSCLACAAIGMAAIVPAGGATRTALDEVFPTTPREVAAAPTHSVQRSEARVSLSVGDAHDLVSATHASSSTKRAKGSKRGSGGSDGGGNEGGLVPTAPLPTNGLGPPVPSEVNEDPPAPGGGGETPGLPGTGGPGEEPMPIQLVDEAKDKIEDLLS